MGRNEINIGKNGSNLDRFSKINNLNFKIQDFSNPDVFNVFDTKGGKNGGDGVLDSKEISNIFFWK